MTGASARSQIIDALQLDTTVFYSKVLLRLCWPFWLKGHADIFNVVIVLCFLYAIRLFVSVVINVRAMITTYYYFGFVWCNVRWTEAEAQST